MHQRLRAKCIRQFDNQSGPPMTIREFQTILQFLQQNAFSSGYESPQRKIHSLHRGHLRKSPLNSAQRTNDKAPKQKRAMPIVKSAGAFLASPTYAARPPPRMPMPTVVKAPVVVVLRCVGCSRISVMLYSSNDRRQAPAEYFCCLPAHDMSSSRIDVMHVSSCLSTARCGWSLR